MATKRVTRRQLLGSVGLTAGASLLAGCGETLHGAAPEGAASAGAGESKPQKTQGNTDNPWRYVRLDPAAVAAEAYRLYPDGGCMYGVFAGILLVAAKENRESQLRFPVDMMKYGEGGVGGWGSLCGAANGGAAVIGLFETDKQRRQNLISELLSWYEATELPIYLPKIPLEASVCIKTIAGSVLCHVSAGKWCKVSGNEVGSKERKERCRRLTADVAVKTVELLNAHLSEPCKFAGPRPEVKSCLSCHDKELHDTVGKMQCDSCHQQLSAKHPAMPCTPLPSNGNPKDAKR